MELNEIESTYLNLIEGEISVKEFEQWVYKSEWLENELSADEYMELISLNYNLSHATYEIGKILKARLHFGKFETVRMLKILDTIIERDGKEGEALMMMYNLYCAGYYFLQDLGIGIGLSIQVPSKYGVENYNELTEAQKKELVNCFYPEAAQLALELKHWISNEEIILTGEKNEQYNSWLFTDTRTAENKKSRLWKAVSSSKQSWWRRIIDKIMPNR